MLSLARQWGKGPVLLKDIAQEEAISEKYLGQIIIAIKNAGFVHAIRGAHGGYQLVSPPKNITIDKIVELLEGDLAIVDCVQAPSLCQKTNICATHQLWTKLNSEIRSFLQGYSLDDLLKMSVDKKENYISYDI
jgi:Rrf2 family protein